MTDGRSKGRSNGAPGLARDRASSPGLAVTAAAGVALATALVLSACLALGLAGGARAQSLDVLNNFAPLSAALAVAAGLASALLARGGGRIAGVALAAVAAGCGGALVAPEYLGRPPLAAASRRGEDLRVLTHNVMALNRDVPATVAAILSSGADIVLLQETDGAMRPALAGLAAVYPYATPCPGRCSLMILSRRPISETRYRFRDGSGAQIGPPLIWATTLGPDGQAVTVATLHYPWPVPVGEQGRLRDALAQAIPADRELLILAGDMNLTPWTYAMAEQDRRLQPMRRLTRGAWSWPAWLPYIDAPVAALPIDQLYAGPDWSLVSLERLARTGSDHYPLLATLRKTAN